MDYQLIYPNKTEERPYYEMAFADGSGWDTRESLRNMPLEGDLPLLAYLSEQTGIRLDSAERVRRIGEQ